VSRPPPGPIRAPAPARALRSGSGEPGSLGRLELVVALASFNLGVELGQLVLALAFRPALTWLRARPHLAAPGLPAASATIGAAGLVWLAARLPW